MPGVGVCAKSGGVPEGCLLAGDGAGAGVAGFRDCPHALREAGPLGEEEKDGWGVKRGK